MVNISRVFIHRTVMMDLMVLCPLWWGETAMWHIALSYMPKASFIVDVVQ